MIGKPLRKKLFNHNWLDATRTDSNRSQTWARLRSHVNLALDDLSLLAEHLPNDKQEEIFTYQRVHPLIKKILFQPIWETDHDDRDFRRTYLAAEIAEECITKCIKQYKKIEPNEILTKPVVEKLQEAMEICNQIALRQKNTEQVK